MKQKVVLFVSLVCFAQLGVTVTRELSSNLTSNSSLEQRFSAEVDRVLLQIASVKEKAVSLLSLENNKEVTDLPIGEKKPPKVAENKQLDTQVPERDPFVPFYSVVTKENPSHLAPLTSYELSQLRVSAIIGDSDGNRMASVETVSGGIFIVKPGTPVGKNGGTVRAITGRSVVIAEPTAGLLSTTSKASVTEITLTKSQL